MGGSLIEKIRERYVSLRVLHPNHELLNYFVLHEDRFKINPDTEIAVEFMERFRSGAPKIEDLKKQQRKVTFEEYQQTLASAVFGGYLKALEDAIEISISSN